MEEIPEEAKAQEKKIVKEPFVFGTKFVDNLGNPVTDVLQRGKKVTCLFFSGGYCPPCRALLPRLVQFYEQANIIERILEIIYVPFDRTEEEYRASVKQMPWVALPYGDARVPKFAENYSIKGVPVLVVIRKNLTAAHQTAKLDVINCIKEERDPEDDINRWVEMIEE